MKRSAGVQSKGAANKISRLYTDESLVAKKITDNLREFGPVETDCRRDKQGRTLRERMLKEMQDAKLHGQPLVFGKIYYDNLRYIFGQPSQPHADLEPKQPLKEVSSQLVQAMLAAKKAKPDRDPFLCYMAKLKEAPNDTEIAGIFRWFLTLKAGCMKQLPVALEALRFIKRLNLHELYKQQFSIIKFWGDKVITAALTKCRSQKQTDQTFLDLYSDLLTLFFPSKSFEQVVNKYGQWDAMFKELAEVAACGSIDRALFEHALAQARNQESNLRRWNLGLERLGAAKIFRGPRGRTQKKKRPMLLLHMLRWLHNTCLIALLTLARSC